MNLQLDLLMSLFKRDQFTLIVLDACRYDYFEHWYRKDIKDGELSKVWSVASCTPQWSYAVLKRAPKDILLITANPGLGSKTHAWGVNSSEHVSKVIDAWDQMGWEFAPGEMEQTPPAVMSDLYGQNADWDKTIVWFIQPHGPSMGETKMPMRMIRELEQKGMDIPLLKHAYRDNLRWALPEVNKVIERSPVRPVIVTSDHGELLGEKGQFWHPPNSSEPILREVPWLEIQ